MEKFFQKFNGKILRLWSNEKNAECDYVLLIDYFHLPDGRVLIETRAFDEREENNQFPYSSFYYFDEVEFAYCEEDQLQW